jgi:hypothetical protein
MSSSGSKDIASYSLQDGIGTITSTKKLIITTSKVKLAVTVFITSIYMQRPNQGDIKKNNYSMLQKYIETFSGCSDLK